MIFYKPFWNKKVKEVKKDTNKAEMKARGTR